MTVFNRNLFNPNIFNVNIPFQVISIQVCPFCRQTLKTYYSEDSLGNQVIRCTQCFGRVGEDGGVPSVSELAFQRDR